MQSGDMFHVEHCMYKMFHVERCTYIWLGTFAFPKWEWIDLRGVAGAEISECWRPRRYLTQRGQICEMAGLQDFKSLLRDFAISPYSACQGRCVLAPVLGSCIFL